MARIETYENQTGVNIGGVVRQDTTDATGNALSRLGQAGISLGASLRAEEERNAAKQQERAENLDNLRLTTALLDHEDRVRTYANEQAASFTGEGADGFGFEKSVSDFALKDAETTIKAGNFNSRPDSEGLPMRFRNSARGVLSGVGEAELQQGLKYQGAVSEKLTAGLATKVALNPDSYEEAAKELVEFTTSTNMGRPKLQERMAMVGLAKLQRARLEAVAGRDPEKFREQTAGVFADTPQPDLAPDLKSVVNGANDAGVEPRVLLSIYSVESAFGKITTNPLSSGTGPFQVLDQKDTLDELGITRDQRNDITIVAPALAAFIKRKTDYMVSKGITPTPGKQYMFWNVGPGVAEAVMKADPNTPMEDIVNRTLSKRSPEFRKQVMTNNPSLYGPGMTAGQVLDSFERKMASAGKEADKRVTPASASSEEDAQKFFEKIMPGGAPMLSAKDLGEVQILAKAKSAELSREQLSLNRGATYATGAAKPDPRDSEAQKDVNEFVVKQGLTTGMVEGDTASHQRAAQLIENVGFAPEAFVNAYSATLASGDMKGKTATYAALADISARNPGAYDATKLPADDRSRVNEYVALTTVSNLSPDEAIARIDFARSPEGKKQAEAQKAGLQSTRAAEVKSLSEADIYDRFDAPWSRSSPTDTEGKFIAAATDAYKEQYVFYRETGRTPEDAKAMALTSLDKNWGSSRVADTGKGANVQTFMPYPPEKAYNATDVGHTWITDQAKNQAIAFAEERYPKMAAKFKAGSVITKTGRGGNVAATPGEVAAVALSDTDLKDKIGVKLVPDLRTAQEARSNQPRGYLLMVRLPDGTTDITTERFYPDQGQADRESAERFRTGQAADRKRKAEFDYPRRFVGTKK